MATQVKEPIRETDNRVPKVVIHFVNIYREMALIRQGIKNYQSNSGYW